MGPPGSDTVWFANTGLITKRQNRFCLFLDPPIGAFSPKCKIKFMDVRLIYMHACFLKGPHICETIKTSILYKAERSMQHSHSRKKGVEVYIENEHFLP